MPATSLHDLLLVDSMHNTLSQLQIAAGVSAYISFTRVVVRGRIHTRASY